MWNFALRSVVLAGALIAAGCTDSVPVANGSAPARTAAATDLGRVAPDTEFDFVVGVALRDQARLNKLLQQPVSSDSAMMPTDFADSFAVSAAEYHKLTSWLLAHDLQVTRTVDARTTVSVHGTAAAIERAFGVELHDFVDSTGRFSASVSGLTMSSSVAGSVSGVVGGFDGAYPWRSHAVKPSPNVVMPFNPRTAAQLETLYKSTAVTQPGKGQTIVILGTGNAPTATDVAGYFTSNKPYGLATNPGTYTVEQVGGPNRDDMQTAEDERGENTLDIDMVAAFAPYATVYHVMTATNNPGLFTDGITYILDKHPKAIAVSVSYGSCERGAAGEMPVLNALFAQAKAQGQTWFFAAGDTGSDGCRNGPGNTVASAGWPASSPYVVGVGGTQIDTTAGEVVWDDNGVAQSFNGGGGGGASESLDKPAFQIGVGPNANDGARDEPDVAALGGLPGIQIYIDGATQGIGGTSAATPMWAGVWALIGQAHNLTTISNGIEQIYALGKAKNGFNDITVGSNGGPGDTLAGGYPAAVGYDLATGWGTPNVAALLTTQGWLP